MQLADGRKPEQRPVREERLLDAGDHARARLTLASSPLDSAPTSRPAAARLRAPGRRLLPSEGAMARGDVRIAVTLACEECKRRNYQTEKSKRNNPDRVEFRKYCRWCGKHTPHKETR